MIWEGIDAFREGATLVLIGRVVDWYGFPVDAESFIRFLGAQVWKVFEEGADRRVFGRIYCGVEYRPATGGRKDEGR